MKIFFKLASVFSLRGNFKKIAVLCTDRERNARKLLERKPMLFRIENGCKALETLNQEHEFSFEYTAYCWGMQNTPSALHTSINDDYAADWLPFQEKKLNPRCAQLLCNLGRASPMVDLDRTKRWSS